jgi:glutamyl-Q tRNA(Asp) synthetase
MAAPVFRFAPSPNGRLHLGHAYSALLNQQMAREAGGRLLLRIEDTDQSRCRREFVRGIYEDLAWLGVQWEEPVRVQSEHFADYDENLRTLWGLGAIYPCFCSRREAQALGGVHLDPDGQPFYPGTCRDLSPALVRDRMARGAQFGWRIHMEGCGDSAAARWGDVLIAKRVVGSYYHIAVVTDDAVQGVTDVVRGEDIEAATPIHRLLQRLLGLPTPRYHHHRLILDGDGTKLSKSRRSTALASLREDGVSAADVRQALGFAGA